MKRYKVRALAVFIIAAMVLVAFPLTRAEAYESVKWIEGSFENFWWFKDGLAKVQNSEGLFGYIDKTGAVAIPLQYEDSGNFSEGYAWVRKDGKEGLIDTKGNIVIPIEYEGIQSVSGGMLAFKQNGLWGYMDVKGNVLIPAQYKITRGYSDGLAAVSDAEVDEEDLGIGNWGFIDTAGKVVIPCQYEYVDSFNEGAAIVVDDNYDYYFIDKAGNKLNVTLDIPNLSVYFSEGVVAVRDIKDDFGNGKIALSDAKGNISLTDMYDYIGSYYDGIAPASNGGEWGLGGPIVMEASYYGGQWGYIDKAGNVVIPFKYVYTEEMHEGYGRVYVIAENGSQKVGFVDKSGNEIAAIYDLATPVSEGLSVVGLDGRLGIMDVSAAAGAQPSAPPAEKSATNMAKATSSSVLVNSVNTEFEAYKIDGNNYFKLRDIAMAVSGTDKQFDVEWDGSRNAINLVSGQTYTPAGGELNVGDGTDKSYTETSSIIYLNGEEMEAKAYNIGGNNYFKLRDLCRAFNIAVIWDGEANTIKIDTSLDYVEE